MQEIQVELSPITATGRNQLDLKVMLGSEDITARVASARMIALRSYIPAEHRGYATIQWQRQYTIGTAILYPLALPTQVLADAIRAYVTDIAPSLEGGVVTSTLASDEEAIVARLTAAQPGFLMVGGRTFRLSPIAEPSNAHSKLLIKMRRDAAEVVRRERDALLVAANREAAIIRTQLQAERAAFNEERIQAKRADGDRFVIPPWLIGHPVMRRDSGYIAVQVGIEYQPIKFTWPSWNLYERFGEDAEDGAGDYHKVALEWPANVAEPVAVDIWLPFSLTNGDYALESAFIDHASPTLPHATHGSFCCQPQGLPQRIRDLGSLAAVQQAINRTFREVNLSSLLGQVEGGNAATKAFVPEDVERFMEAWEEHETFTAIDPRDYNARIIEVEARGAIWQNEGVGRR